MSRRSYYCHVQGDLGTCRVASANKLQALGTTFVGSLAQSYAVGALINATGTLSYKGKLSSRDSLLCVALKLTLRRRIIPRRPHLPGHLCPNCKSSLPSTMGIFFSSEVESNSDLSFSILPRSSRSAGPSRRSPSLSSPRPLSPSAWLASSPTGVPAPTPSTKQVASGWCFVEPIAQYS